MSVIAALADFVCNASAAALPADERTLLRRHVADTLLAAIAGARTTEGVALARILSKQSAAEAAGRLAAIIRHTEIDDIHTRSCTTPSSVTVATALTIAQARGVTDPDAVASAIWVGTNLMTRLGVAIDGARILYRSVWPTYFTAPLGAAAIAARLSGLTPTQTAHALSLALMLTAGRSGRFQGAIPGRSVLLAIATADGIRAADAAAQGVGGDPSLLDGPWLKDAQGIDARLDTLTASLGAGSCYREMSLKPYCSAKQAVASVEALSAILREGVSADSIGAVRVRVPPPYARMIAMKAEPEVRASSIVSASYQMGLAACRPERLYDIERSNATGEAAVMAFAAKVVIETDESLLPAFPANFPAEVEVEANGSQTRKRVIEAAGDPAHPLDDAALLAKAERVLSFLPAAPEAARVIETGLNGFASSAGCRDLIAMMAEAGAR